MTTINIKQSEGKKAIKNFLRITNEEENKYKKIEREILKEVFGE